MQLRFLSIIISKISILDKKSGKHDRYALINYKSGISDKISDKNIYHDQIRKVSDIRYQIRF